MEVRNMWRVYRERARERMGTIFPEAADSWRYSRGEEALAAFSREVDGLLQEGYRLSADIVPVDMEGVVEWAGLEGEEDAVLVGLSQE